jgi:hypothetical protein
MGAAKVRHLFVGDAACRTIMVSEKKFLIPMGSTHYTHGHLDIYAVVMLCQGWVLESQKKKKIPDYKKSRFNGHLAGRVEG